MCRVTDASETTLDLDDRAAGLARRFLRDSCCGAHHRDVARDAALLVSELVTNAVRHGLPPIRIRVECEDARALRVNVADASPDGPLRREAGTDAETGRGLQLVDLISDQWGVEGTEEGGKRVWFRMQVLNSSGS